MGFIGMWDSKECGFSAVSVINWLWFLHSSLDLGVFLRSYFIMIIDKTNNKIHFQIMLMEI